MIRYPLSLLLIFNGSEVLRYLTRLEPVEIIQEDAVFGCLARVTSPKDDHPLAPQPFSNPRYLPERYTGAFMDGPVRRMKPRPAVCLKKLILHRKQDGKQEALVFV